MGSGGNCETPGTSLSPLRGLGGGAGRPGEAEARLQTSLRDSSRGGKLRQIRAEARLQAGSHSAPESGFSAKPHLTEGETEARRGFGSSQLTRAEQGPPSWQIQSSRPPPKSTAAHVHPKMN